MHREEETPEGLTMDLSSLELKLQQRLRFHISIQTLRLCGGGAGAPWVEIVVRLGVG